MNEQFWIGLVIDGVLFAAIIYFYKRKVKKEVIKYGREQITNPDERELNERSSEQPLSGEPSIEESDVNGGREDIQDESFTIPELDSEESDRDDTGNERDNKTIEEHSSSVPDLE